MADALTLRHPSGVTPIWVGREALREAAPSLSDWLRHRTVFALSSGPILALHGDRLRAACAAAGRLEVLEVPDGEVAKGLATAGEVWSEMLRRGGKRDSRVVAFGGGSIGDLAGFVAGCFLRGVGFVQIPTTLLAQVDAAIGGKTGIDLPEAKNSVGLFHHPAMVIADSALLSTLPVDELRSGLAEVVKSGAVLDAELFEHCERLLGTALAGDGAALSVLVPRAARAKIEVVQRDPTEQGERQLLNFGHTLGHAIETALGYRQLRHGEAVAYGMLFAARLSRARGASGSAAARLRSLIRRFDLPALPSLPAADLVELLGRDKKAREGGLSWVLMDEIGRGRIGEPESPERVAEELGAFLVDPWA